MRIVFTGGGTSGHVAPNIAIIKELGKIIKKEGTDLDILYIGRMSGIERELILNENVNLKEDEKKIKYKGIFSGKFRRYWDWRNLTDPFLIVVGFLQSLFAIFFFKPQIVFAKGGFVTVPVGIASWILRIPLIIHESDSVLGLSNKILLPFSKRIILGFPLNIYQKIPFGKSFFGGNPVREDIRKSKIKKEDLCEKLDLDKRKPMILILGGSQGAQRINEFVDSVLEKLLEKYTVIHSAGEKGAGYFKQKRTTMDESIRKNYLAYAYITDEMGDFIKNADIIVSRAGANAVSEIIYAKKPSILIPFPHASADHQNKNALYLSQKGIASVLEERHLTAYKLLEEIEYLIENEEEREKMVENMKEVFLGNSAKIIAEEILKDKV